jgi:UDP-glucose 4-epimerase
MNILLTGALGFIGSHTACCLVNAGYCVILLDNLSNSTLNTLTNLNKITGKDLIFYEADVRNQQFIEEILKTHEINIVLHLAGFKSVSDSLLYPIDYYSNNVEGSISIIQAMRNKKVKKLIYSSSATVYGAPQHLPYDESHPTNPINPYGRSKLQVEHILSDVALSDPEWSIVCLRYFNPAGAHESSLIGEIPQGLPNNLMPCLSQVAVGRLPYVRIFGNDYHTKDGTGERDYIHIMDLAEGHLATVEYLELTCGYIQINLGSGETFSVLEMIEAFQNASKKTLAIKIEPRRSGDLPICYANPALANSLLNWRTTRSIKEMCESAWNFQMLSKKF